MNKSGFKELLRQLFSAPYRMISIALICVGIATLLNAYFGSSLQLHLLATRLENALEEQQKIARERSEEAMRILRGSDNFLSNTQEAENWIKRSEQDGIYLLVYENDKLSFWTTNHALPPSVQSVPLGSSLLKMADGYYLTECQGNNSLKVISLIPVKSEYNYTNAYLQNSFNPRLNIPNYITLGTAEKGIAVALSGSNSPLFYLQYDNTQTKSFGNQLQNIFWILGFLSLFFFIDEYCQKIAKEGRLLHALGILSSTVLLIRFLMMTFQFPFSFHQGWDLFSPTIYASGNLLPSLGDFVINGLLLLWIVYFVHRNAKNITAPPNWHRYGLFSLAVGMILVIYVLSDLITFCFNSITVNSNIPFDLTNILSLNIYSYIAYIMLGVSLYIFFLVCNGFMIWFDTFQLNKEEKFFVFIVGVLFGFIYKVAIDALDLVTFTNAAYILALDRFRTKNIRYFSTRSLLIILVLFSFVSSDKLQEFKATKDYEKRKALAIQLDSGSDPITEYLLKDLMEKVRKDSVLMRSFKNSSISSDSLNERLEKLYFGNYFNKYSIRFSRYDAKRQALEGTKNTYENVELLLKLSGYEKGKTGLYKIENQGGNQFYLCRLPIKYLDATAGTLYVELQSKTIENTNDFPDLLVAGSSSANKDLATYSYAIYKNNKLTSKYGDFTYSNQDPDFNAVKIGFSELHKDGYSHLVYNPNIISRIVLSKTLPSFYDRIAIFSYFFGFLSIFLFSITLIRKSYQYTRRRWIPNGFLVILKDIRNSGMSFKTRIQLSIIFTVVLSLVVVGVITFSYISNRYYDEQYTRLAQKVKSVQQAFESLHYSSTENLNNKANLAYDLSFISSLFNTDVSLYDTTGKLILATQARVFEQGLLSDQMNAAAFTNVCRKQKTGYIAEESVGNLPFISANAPIRTDMGETIAYVSLPFFANRDDYRAQVSYFVNALINVYALVFTLIGFIAFFVASAITAPFLVIEENLRKTKIGQINEPIYWHRNDEIGSLVGEYNRMIAELEDSAEKLAQSERESAWREMAKQVAHEIKNPLTPLKLGLQHLERAWKNNDPDFDKKFERFNKTFIQQVETLSGIATEFSNFAKMPLGQEQRIDLIYDLRHVVNLFKQTENLHINFTYPRSVEAYVMIDPDQLIRTFNNLIKNAVQAIPPEREGQIDITVQIDSSMVTVVIRDNGTGIPPDIQQKIFAPNFTTKNSGMGLGLAIVKQMIENAKGSIHFETKADEGTSFFVSLPLYFE